LIKYDKYLNWGIILKKGLTTKSKIGIFFICLSLILFALGFILLLSFPNAYVRTYNNDNIDEINVITEKGSHPGIIPVCISPIIGLFGLISIFFDIHSKENKGLKYFTITTIVFTVISIILVFLVLYWMFTPLEDPILLHGSSFLFVSTITYIPYLIYFGIVYRRLKIDYNIVSVKAPQ
jgi:hypothetical protein